MIEFEKPNITRIIRKQRLWRVCRRTTWTWLWYNCPDSLRRVLLASLPGAACPSINVKVYSTGDTVQESVRTLYKYS